MLTRPTLGFGLGLRVDHYETILNERPAVDWFEALTENYLVPGGKPLYHLTRIREHYPMVMHGVSMSIGSTQPLDRTYLAEVKALAQRIEPAWISDHLCWTGVAGKNLHDLMPLPYTEEALKHVVHRVRTVRNTRYSLLRGFFHGEGDAAADAAEHRQPRLHSVTLTQGAYAVGRALAELDLAALGAGVARVRRRGIRVGEPAPETRFEAGDVVVVLGEPESLAAAEIRLLQGTK